MGSQLALRNRSSFLANDWVVIVYATRLLAVCGRCGRGHGCPLTPRAVLFFDTDKPSPRALIRFAKLSVPLLDFTHLSMKRIEQGSLAVRQGAFVADVLVAARLVAMIARALQRFAQEAVRLGVVGSEPDRLAERRHRSPIGLFGARPATILQELGQAS